MPTTALLRTAANDESRTRADTLADQAYRRLHRALMTGGLLPEQVLTVRGIADEYGVSLTPVREAIQRLVAAGALTSRTRARSVCRGSASKPTARF